MIHDGGTEISRPVVLTRYEAAQVARLSVGALDECIRRGDILSIRIGRRVLVPRIALERVLAGEGERP